MTATASLPGNEPGSDTVQERMVLISGLPEEERSLELALPDEQFGQYTLPLSTPQMAEIIAERSFSSGTISDWRNLLIPLAVQRVDANGCGAPLRPGCRLYLFRDGYLWRELEAVRYAGNLTGFRDVNLTELYGMDDRIASGAVQSHILLPYRMSDYEADFQVALSDIPWAWERIQAMGGMAPDDPRNTAGENAACDEADNKRNHRCSAITFDDNTLRNKRVWLTEDRERRGYFKVDYRFEEGYRRGCATTRYGEDITLVLADPLQEARNHKRHHDEALEVLATCLESEAQGPLGLAALIKGLTESDSSGRLESGLSPFRYDREMLERWEQIQEDLPERAVQVEARLLRTMQSERFLAAISDYTESSNPATRVAGVSMFLRLQHNCVEPGTLAWLCQVVDGDVTPLHPLSGDDEGVIELLHTFADRTEAQPEEAPLWRSLNGYDKAAILAFTPLALKEMVEITTKTWKHLQNGGAVKDLTWLQRRLSTISLQPVSLITQPIQRLMPAPSRSAQGIYAYMPRGVMDAIREFSQRRIPQVFLSNEPLADLLKRAESSRTWQGARLSLLTGLYGLQLTFAIKEMNSATSEEASSEARLNTIAASGSLFAMLTEQGKKATERWLVQNGAPPQSNGSSRQKVGVRSQPATDSRIRVVSAIHLTLRLLTMGLGVLIGIAEGIKGFIQLIKGWASKNLGLMFGGAINILGGLLLCIFAVKGTIIFPLLALVLLTGGTLMISAFTRSPLENALRHGWFGRSPYAIEDRAFSAPEGYQHHQQERYRAFLNWIGRGEYQYWHLQIPHQLENGQSPDYLSNEISGVIRELHNFEATIKVHALQRSYALAPGQRAPRAEHVVVEADIQLGRFTPLSSTLSGHLRVRSTGARYAIARDCYLCERRDPDDQNKLSGLRLFIQLPRDQVTRAGVELSLQQDIDGTGQWLMPPDSATADGWRWQRTGGRPTDGATWVDKVIAALDPKPNVGSMHESEWERLKATATLIPEESGDSMVWVETESECKLMPRSEALFRPLLPGQLATM